MGDGKTQTLLVAATVPDFLSLNLFVALALLLVLAGSLVWLVTGSWASFAKAGGRETRGAQLRRMVTIGRVRPGSYYTAAALLFVVAAGAVAWLNAFVYVNDPSGLAAYTGPLEERSASQLILADEGPRLRAAIADCGWDDRFSPTQLEQRWNAPAGAAETPARDPYVAEYLAFRDAVEAQFIRQAPGAISRLSEALGPVFAVLGALFLVGARGLLRAPPEAPGFTVVQVVLLALLAHAFVMLAYFAILEYHVAVEISRALAAGRIVCADHVSALFVAQIRALFVAGALLFALVALSPGSILSKL